jgi:hypothetical protein
MRSSCMVLAALVWSLLPWALLAEPDAFLAAVVKTSDYQKPEGGIESDNPWMLFVLLVAHLVQFCLLVHILHAVCNCITPFDPFYCVVIVKGTDILENVGTMYIVNICIYCTSSY